jgi:protein associated with RNAse G/E
LNAADKIRSNALLDDDVAEREVIVSACKYDGRERRRWSAHIISKDDDLIVLDAEFAEEIKHELLGVVARGTISREYYWLSRWYNIFRFRHPDGELRSFYCNINIPPTFDGRVLSYIDLDIDILVEPDLSYQVVDEDEFALNAAKYKYPPEIHVQAYQALEELKALIEKRVFPFSDLM